ncbi:MAG TPA: HEAT repeat domain-containing protein [Ktedonobacterales bacterium]
MQTDDAPNDERDVDQLIAALKAGTMGERIRAAKALGALGDARAVDPLLEAFQEVEEQEEDEDEEADGRELRMEIAEALGKIGDQRAFEPLFRFLERELPLKYSNELTLCAWVIDAVGMLRDERAIPLLIEALEHADVDVRKAARSALAEIGEPAVEPLNKVLLTEGKQYRWFAADALYRIGDQRAAEPFRQALQDRSDNEYVRAEAAKALGKLGGAGVLALLVRRLHDKRELETVRRAAASGLGLLGDRRAFEPLLQALKEGTAGMRWDVAAALGDLSDPRGVEPLIALLKDSYMQVRWEAAKALGKLGDKRALAPLHLARHQDRTDGLFPWFDRAAAEAIRSIEERHRQ